MWYSIIYYKSINFFVASQSDSSAAGIPMEESKSTQDSRTTWKRISRQIISYTNKPAGFKRCSKSCVIFFFTKSNLFTFVVLIKAGVAQW